MSQPVWVTPADQGIAVSLSAFTLVLLAQPVAPAVSVNYTLIAGSLPPGLTLTGATISGQMPSVDINTPYSWTIRARDDLGNIRDRAFTITAAPQPAPYFIDNYLLFTTVDSVWVQHQVAYYNTDPAEPVISTVEGVTLPPGLELTPGGLIQGYPQIPTLGLTVPAVNHTVSSISTTVLRTASTVNLQAGAQVVFAASSGNIVAGTYYYIREILNSTDYTISLLQSGDVFTVGTVASIVADQQAGTPTTPIKKNYTFKLKLDSDLGDDLGEFQIQVVNQNLPVAQGGPGLPANSRPPVIANSRTPLPLPDTAWFPYLLPPPRDPLTSVAIPLQFANSPIAWRMLGYDFDGDAITYSFTGLPPGLTGDPATGWITGTVVSGSPSLTTYNFTVQVAKTAAPLIVSAVYNFSMAVSNGVVNDITWTTPSNLGTMVNCEISELTVAGASSNQTLSYRLVPGSTLPANLSLSADGLIVGRVADQPAFAYLNVGDTTTWTFTVEAYSPTYPGVSQTRTFTLDILQAFSEPNENLYLKALVDIPTRITISNMLNDTTLIPPGDIYRLGDPHFGIANNITVAHAYGILSSGIDDYYNAVQQNHYLRNITLGEIKTARALDDDGNVMYEVVYSQIIDNLVNEAGVSIPPTITWPTTITYGVNYFTAMTYTFTSYVQILQQLYYASLAPLTANTLHPASLINMRQRVEAQLGQVPTFRLLPRWMTSQQPNGAALGYVPAWVICYTKPGKAQAIANNLRTNWDYVLHDVDFEIDRFFVNRSSSYNLQPNLANKTWLTLPSGNPPPVPADTHDFQIIFPQKTILPQ